MERERVENAKELIDRCKDLGGFKFSTLEPNTKMIVETRNSLYEFIVGEETTVTGGSTPNGVRFPEPTKVRIHGSTYGGSMIRMDWIGEDMHLEFGIVGTDKLIVTSSIKNVILKDADGDWYYSMDWNKKNTT